MGYFIFSALYIYELSINSLFNIYTTLILFPTMTLPLHTVYIDLGEVEMLYKTIALLIALFVGLIFAPMVQAYATHQVDMISLGLGEAYAGESRQEFVFRSPDNEPIGVWFQGEPTMIIDGAASVRLPVSWGFLCLDAGEYTVSILPEEKPYLITLSACPPPGTAVTASYSGASGNVSTTPVNNQNMGTANNNNSASSSLGAVITDGSSTNPTGPGNITSPGGANGGQCQGFFYVSAGADLGNLANAGLCLIALQTEPGLNLGNLINTFGLSGQLDASAALPGVASQTNASLSAQTSNGLQADANLRTSTQLGNQPLTNANLQANAQVGNGQPNANLQAGVQVGNPQQPNVNVQAGVQLENTQPNVQAGVQVGNTEVNANVQVDIPQGNVQVQVDVPATDGSIIPPANVTVSEQGVSTNVGDVSINIPLIPLFGGN